MVLAEDLRQAVLQAAIQGELTERSSADTDIQNTLLEISDKRKNLDIDRKLLVSKEIDLGEVPFELPKTWTWIRLGSICEVITKGSSPKWQGINYTENGLLFITSENVGVEKLLLSERKYVDEKFDEISPRSSLKYGDLLTNIVGASIGRTALYNLEERANINQAVCIIRLINIEFAPYVMKYMNSNTAYKIMMEDKVETARPNISLSNISDFLIPLPPIEEQQRIVVKINEIMPKIDEYEKIEKELEVLKKEFPTDMKDALLQAAMQGKLTEQLESDSGVDELLLNIEADKQTQISNGLIKKDKRLFTNYVDKEDMPIPIPTNWRGVTIGSIVYKLTDGTHKTPKYAIEGVKFVSVKDMSSGKLDLSNTKFITQEEHDELYKRCNPEKGDMLLSKVGTTGVPAIIDTDEQFSLFVSVALLKYNHRFINEKFLYYLLMSPLVQEQVRENTRGIGNKNWVLDFIAKTVIVLPPIEEQQRIVERLDVLLPLCEELRE